MKKRLLAVLMAATAALICVFGFSACGDPEDNQHSQNGQDHSNDTTEPSGTETEFTDFVMPENGFDTESPVEIKFYHTMGQALRVVLQTYITEFNVLYPNVTIVEDRIGGYEDVCNQIIDEIGKGKQPNLAYCYPDDVAGFNQFGAVQTLDDFLPESEYSNMKVTLTNGAEESLCLTAAQKDDFIEAYYNEGKVYGDNKMYTLPLSKSTEVLYYNKTFFDEHNLTPPTTWDEMEEVCKTIKELDPFSTPLGYDSESNWFITMCEQLGSSYTSSDGEHFLFDNEKNREFVEKLKDWYDNGYFITQEINKAYTSNLFRTMRSYMCIGSSAGARNQIPQLVGGEYPFEVGITSIPQVNPYNPKVISQGPSVCIFKQSDPQEVLASWLFAKFLATNVGFQAQFSSVSGYVPVIKTVTENLTYLDNLAKADGFGNLTFLAAKVCLEQAQSYFVSPAFVGASKAREEVGKLMTSVFTHQKTIDKAFEDAIFECRYFAGSTEED